jgi:hypothetical protein
MEEDQDLDAGEENSYGYYVEQDDLETVKAWLKIVRAIRTEEAMRLEEELEEATAKLEKFERKPDERRKWLAKANLELDLSVVIEREMDTERYHRLLRDNRDYTQRRLRDLVKQDREDLEWIRKLEREEREATKEYRPLTKSQQRAADWKTRQKG